MEIKKDKYSIKFFPSEVTSWKQEGNIFYFNTADTSLEVKLLSDKIIRFRYAPENKFQRDFSYAVVDGLQSKPVNLSVYEDKLKFDIMTEYLVIQIYRKNLKVTILDR